MRETLRSFFLYTGLCARRFAHGFKITSGKKVRFTGSLFLAFIFMTLIGAGFYRVIEYIRAVPIAGSALVTRMVGIVFLSLFVLLVYSSVITAFSTLYFSKDNEFLAVSPFRWGGVILGKLLQTVFYSSWMTLTVLVPLISALGYVFRPPFYAYAVIAAACILYFITAAAAGSAGVILIVHLFPARKIRDLLIVGLVFLGTSLYMLFRTLNLEQILRPGQESIAAEYLRLIAMPRNLWAPSYWMTGIADRLVRSSGGWAGHFMVLALFAGAAAALYYLVGLRFFYSGWEKIKSQERKRYFSSEFPSNPVLAKDVKTFFRDTSQWTQAVLIAALIVIYIFNIYKLPIDQPHIHYLIAFLNIGMVSFVMAAVGLRFSFSSLSLEGRFFWLLISAPMDMNKLIRIKFMENFFPLQLMGMILIVVSNRILETPLLLSLLSTAAVLAAGVSLTCMGIGMGCIYPMLDAESPAEIETSWGGVMYMIAGFFYIAVTMAVLAIWVRMDFMHRVTGADVNLYAAAGVTAVLVVVNAAACFIPMRAGIRSLKRLEFNV